MFYLAGLYRIEGNEARCTILTRQAAPSIAFIHDRMPVLLHRDALSDWLNPRYDAHDVMLEAITEVSFTPVDGVRQMQLGI